MSVMTLTSPACASACAVPAELWKSAQQTFETRFTRPIYEMWVRPIQAVALEGNELLLSVQSNFAREWVEGRLKGELSGAISDAFGSPLDLRFTVADAPSAPNAPTPIAVAAVAIETPKATRLNARYTFDEFVIGNSNRFAHAAAIAVASAPARAYNPLFLYGGSGLGKTHLLHAIGNRVKQDRPEANVVYVTSEQFTNEFISAVQSNDTATFRNQYRAADVLLIDDIQFLANRETTQEEFFHTFNALHEAGKQIVVASDRAPKEIAALEARLRSRFEWGLTADVQTPDLEVREAILRRKAQHETANVPEDVLAYIARVVPSNVRELEGALTRVIVFASVKSAAVTLDLASEALKAIAVVASAQRVTISKIKETVAQAHGLTVREMDNGRRDQRLAEPRQIAMYLTTELTNYSLPQIAREFGKKDHTTIMYARDKMRERATRDEAYRNKLRQLSAMCHA